MMTEDRFIKSLMIIKNEGENDGERKKKNK